MSIKTKSLAVLLGAAVLCGCGSEGTSLVHINSGADTASSAADSEAAPAASNAAACTQTVSLFKGETRTLDITKTASAIEPEIVSSDPSVVSVNGKDIKAEKCGDAQVTVTFTDGDVSFKTVLDVSVAISRFDTSIEYTAGSITAETEIPGVVVHRQLKEGENYQIKTEGGDEVKYSSSDDKIASVSDTGLITATGEGSAVIRADVTSGGKTTSFVTAVEVYKKKPSTKLDQSEIDTLFGASVFVGSSLGSGQLYYFNAQEEGFLGDPTFLVLDSYGIFNDEGINGPEYQLSYNGVAAPVRELIGQTGASNVFINVGTNDMYGDADYVSEAYIKYIEGIVTENPECTIYIESITPVYLGSESGYLNNDTVDAINKTLEEYCDTQPDMYYIDVSTALKNENGGLDEKYTSDYYVHLNNDAYEVWTNKLISTVKNMLIYRMRAQDAVDTYTEAKTDTALAAAKKALEKVGEGRYKNLLMESLPS